MGTTREAKIALLHPRDDLSTARSAMYTRFVGV
jgi:hypothetical protein